METRGASAQEAQLAREPSLPRDRRASPAGTAGNPPGGAVEETHPGLLSPDSGLRCDGERGTGSSRPHGEFLHPGNPSTGSPETSLPSLQATRGKSQARPHLEG